MVIQEIYPFQSLEISTSCPTTWVHFTVQGRSLNQAAVDAIGARIDAYDQAWERRWEESDKRWEKRMDRMFEGIKRIDTRVEEIASFMGQAAEIQIGTQHKLDKLNDTIEKQQHSFDQRIDRLVKAMEGYQEISKEQAKSTSELIKLATLIMQKAA